MRFRYVIHQTKLEITIGIYFAFSLCDSYFGYCSFDSTHEQLIDGIQQCKDGLN